MKYVPYYRILQMTRPAFVQKVELGKNTLTSSDNKPYVWYNVIS